MAYEQPVWVDGFQSAAADLTLKQGYGVKLTAAKTVGLATANGEAIFGVLTNAPNTGETAAVGRVGNFKAVAGALIAAGAKVMVANGGKFITAATSGSHVVGFAPEGAGADGEVFTLSLLPGAPIP